MPNPVLDNKKKTLQNYILNCDLRYDMFFSENLIAVGGYQPYSNKTELLSLSNTWTTEAEYPFGTGYSNYS